MESLALQEQSFRCRPRAPAATMAIAGEVEALPGQRLRPQRRQRRQNPRGLLPMAVLTTGEKKGEGERQRGISLRRLRKAWRPQQLYNDECTLTTASFQGKSFEALISVLTSVAGNEVRRLGLQAEVLQHQGSESDSEVSERVRYVKQRKWSAPARFGVTPGS